MFQAASEKSALRERDAQVQASALRGVKKMVQQNDGQILEGGVKRCRGWKAEKFVPAPAQQKRVSRKLRLRADQFSPSWWETHLQQRSLQDEQAAAAAAAISRHGARSGGSGGPHASVRRCRRLRTEQETRKDTAARIAALEEAAGKAQEQKALLKTFDGWKLANRKSQIQELFESRGHFFLIGAACHAELAHVEHGWARLKSGVKPYVDGTITTLRELVANAMVEIQQRERLLDAARCRRVMQAYRVLAERGEVATADKLLLWEREHEKHRDVHVGELAALQQAAGISVPEAHAKIAAKMTTESRMKQKIDAKVAVFRKKIISKKRSHYNRLRYDADAAATRKKKHK